MLRKVLKDEYEEKERGFRELLRYKTKISKGKQTTSRMKCMRKRKHTAHTTKFTSLENSPISMFLSAIKIETV